MMTITFSLTLEGSSAHSWGLSRVTFSYFCLAERIKSDFRCSFCDRGMVRGQQLGGVVTLHGFSSQMLDAGQVIFLNKMPLHLQEMAPQCCFLPFAERNVQT
jgi:hypothetical protein